MRMSQPMEAPNSGPALKEQSYKVASIYCVIPNKNVHKKVLKKVLKNVYKFFKKSKIFKMFKKSYRGLKRFEKVLT